MKSIQRLLSGTSAWIGLTCLAVAASGPGQQPAVWMASDLVGMKVVSQEGESLGKIEDVVVHPGGMHAHAVLSFGGWLGMGDKLFAMPWSVLRSVAPETGKDADERTLALQVDKETLKSAPGFDKKNWPSLASPDWSREIDAFYAVGRKPAHTQPVPAAAPTSVITWRVSELKGFDVETPTGEELGEIEEVAIDANGRVSYVALKHGGSLLGGAKHVAVPWDALKFSLAGDKGDEKVITLASTEKQLEQAPEFKKDKEHRAEMSDPRWITRVYTHFSVAPYWTAQSAAGSKD
ncbi:MAG TPA: PRC-barrel domain-containing protein [Planctomycetota bacterium]